MAGMGVLCVPLAMLLVFGCLGCATPCVQALAEESSTDSKFTNVKAGVEVLKRFVVSFVNSFVFCWFILGKHASIGYISKQRLYIYIYRKQILNLYQHVHNNYII